MPFVQVKTRSGRINYHYTISTPKSDAAEHIDPSLPVVLFFHALAFPHVFHCMWILPSAVLLFLTCHGSSICRSSTSQVQSRCIWLQVAWRYGGRWLTWRLWDNRGGGRCTSIYGTRYKYPDTNPAHTPVQNVINLPPCHFVAMDLGSPVALQIAISHPDRVLSFFLMSQTCLDEVRFLGCYLRLCWSYLLCKAPRCVWRSPAGLRFLDLCIPCSRSIRYGTYDGVWLWVLSVHVQ